MPITEVDLRVLYNKETGLETECGDLEPDKDSTSSIKREISYYRWIERKLIEQLNKKSV